MEPRDSIIRRPTRSKTWKAPVSSRKRRGGWRLRRGLRARHGRKGKYHGTWEIHGGLARRIGRVGRLNGLSIGKPTLSWKSDPLVLLGARERSQPQIEAKKRVLNCNYNARALEEIAGLDLALMDRGLKAAYGGLAGSSATDIINVVRGSFAACVDVRALCKGGWLCSIPL